MEAKSRGGAGRGQGRKAKDGATGLRQRAYRITQSQHEKVNSRGGSAWIRYLIDKATEQDILPKAEPVPATPSPEADKPKLKVTAGNPFGFGYSESIPLDTSEEAKERQRKIDKALYGED